LSAGDRVIVAPPDGMVDGDRVRVAGADKDSKPEKVSAKEDVKG
jgi:hypothetical protein